MAETTNSEYNLTDYPSFRLRYNLCKNSLSETDKKVAEFFIANPNAVYQSITDVVKEAGVGYGSVIRFCQRLGCNGYQDFKVLLAHDLALFSEEKVRSRSTPLNEYLTRTIDHLKATCHLCNDDLLEKVAGLFLESNQIVIGAVAGSAPTAVDFGYHLIRVGIPCTVLTDGFLFGIHAASLTSKDLLFIINFSGATKSLVHGAELAKKADVKVVAITNFLTSPMAKIADHCFFTAEDRDPLSVELHSSLPSIFVVGALFEKILGLRKNAAEMVRKTFSAISDQKM